jgi:hypothetical protein
MGWEYRATVINDDLEKLNELMEQWANAGWELVNGAASTFAVVEYIPRGSGDWAPVDHTKFTLFWRKETTA